MALCLVRPTPLTTGSHIIKGSHGHDVKNLFLLVIQIAHLLEQAQNRFFSVGSG